MIVQSGERVVGKPALTMESAFILKTEINTIKIKGA